MFRIIGEFAQGFEAMNDVDKAVTIFGSARLQPDNEWYVQAEKLARELADSGYTVLSGGGPGIMEAANKGAIEAGGTSVGLNITLPFETANNAYQTIELSFEYFYSRKATFFMHSLAYVALPGGYGTMDELFEALTLMQTGKIPRGPVVLVGSSFWGGLIDWVRERMLAMGMISPADLDLFQVEDDPRSVVEIIAAFHDRQRNDALYVPTLPA